MKRLTKGFTLIELLIVVAILGILAIVVLSALNPIEQINKSRDSGGVSDAEQLLQAVDRYFASNALYPWQNAQTDSQATGATATTMVLVDADWGEGTCTAGTDCALDNLSINTVELKESFVDRITSTDYATTLYAFNAGSAGDATYACFQPSSDSFQREAADRCQAAGGLPSDAPTDACPAVGCVDDSDISTCFYCVP